MSEKIPLSQDEIDKLLAEFDVQDGNSATDSKPQNGQPPDTKQQLKLRGTYAAKPESQPLLSQEEIDALLKDEQ